jgi:FtsH-binding integral membrane protein
LYALISGFQNHKITSYLYLGISGLWLLIFAVFFGELAEQVLTFLGSLIVAYSHYQNFQTCRKLDCDCHDDKPVL